MGEGSVGTSFEVEERRMLTIMFGDMIGSTEISERIGEDSMHELMKRFQSACTEAVIENDGTLTNWMGDGFMACFGYPAKHEDAAVRAVEAGLAVVGVVERLAPELKRLFDADVRIRVGIHTGLVVVSQAPGREDDPNAVFFVGETPNIASRLEAVAPPNSVLVSEATHDLIKGYFEVEALGPHDFKGVSRKISTFRAVRRTAAVSRYLAATAGLTPLVGREDELRALEELVIPEAGHPSVVLALSGEPGLGKTRLLHELLQRMRSRYDVLQCLCTPRTTTSPLYPFAQLLRATELISDEQDLDYGVFAPSVRTYVDDETAIARIAKLAGIELPADVKLPDVTAEQALRDTASAVISWLASRASSSGSLLVIDDVQWIDPTSRDLLIQMRDGAAGPVVVMAYRPEPGTEWISTLCDSTLELGPLSQADCMELIGHVTAAQQADIAAAAARSDGVPLFAEELARTLESGELRGLGSIPNSLHDLILSRLDRLPEAKILAQIGASIGRQFELDLLAEASELPLRTVLNRAQLLESSRIWERERIAGKRAYGFRHALIQDAAYDSQIRERKHQVHGRLADVLLSRKGAETAVGLATIAYHLEHAGASRLVAAVRAWVDAGFATANAGAHLEAISHFSRGLDLLRGIDDPMVTAPLELEAELGLGASLSTTAGYGQPRVAAAFARARELCGMMGSPPQLFPAVWGSWTFYLVRGEYSVAEDLARACLEISSAAGDPALEIETASALGITYFYQGRILEALEQLTSAAARYDETAAISPFQRFQHPAVAALAHLTLVHWLTGDTDRALSTALEAVDLARSCEEHLRWFAREYAETFCAALGAYMDDAEFCLEHAQAAIDICNQHGSRMFLAGAEIYKGYAQVRIGEVDEGLKRLEIACQNYLLTGATLFRPYHLTRLAIAREAVGDHQGALEVLIEAVELSERNGELIHLPEGLFIRGQTLLTYFPHRAHHAVADFERSLEVAQTIGSHKTRARIEQHLAASIRH